MARYS